MCYIFLKGYPATEDLMTFPYHVDDKLIHNLLDSIFCIVLPFFWI